MRATYRFSRTEFGADSDEVTIGVTQMKFPHSHGASKGSRGIEYAHGSSADCARGIRNLING